MGEPFVPCIVCARALRTLEEQCPFCGAAQGWRFLVLRLRGIARAAVVGAGIAACAACTNDPAPSGPPAAELVPMVPAPAMPAPPPVAPPAVEMHAIPPPVVQPAPPPTKATRRVRRARVLKRVPDPILIAPPYGAPPIAGPRLT